VHAVPAVLSPAIEGNTIECPACRPAKRYKTVDSNGKATGVCGCGVKAHLRTTKRPGPSRHQAVVPENSLCLRLDSMLSFSYPPHTSSQVPTTDEHFGRAAGILEP
jgi:hypothetical protein